MPFNNEYSNQHSGQFRRTAQRLNVGGFSDSHTANPSVTKPAGADASKAAVSAAPGKIDGKPAAVESSIKR